MCPSKSRSRSCPAQANESDGKQVGSPSRKTSQHMGCPRSPCEVSEQEGRAPSSTPKLGTNCAKKTGLPGARNEPPPPPLHSDALFSAPPWPSCSPPCLCRLTNQTSFLIHNTTSKGSPEPATRALHHHSRPLVSNKLLLPLSGSPARRGD